MMKNSPKIDAIDTIYGRFNRISKRRLDMTYDYEAAEIEAFRKIAAQISPTLMLDIGANIGVYSIFLAGIETISRILAFEPAPAAYQLLEQNIALQNSARFDCRNVALSDVAGTARFAIFGDLAGNNAIEETSFSKTGGLTETIIVPTAKLDDEIAATGETFMCKIDVEGHELNVLAGATGFLTENTGVLQIESFTHTKELDALLAQYQYARVFRVKHDYYYTNITDPSLRSEIVEILFGEVAQALMDLKDERRRRRKALRTARETVDLLRFRGDPITGARDREKRRRLRRKPQKT